LFPFPIGLKVRTTNVSERQSDREREKELDSNGKECIMNLVLTLEKEAI